MELAGPGWEERAAQLGLPLRERDVLVERFSGTLLPVGTNASAIRAMLGMPFEHGAAFVRHDLGVRPDYVFEFLLSKDTQTVIDSGYVRRHRRELHLALPRNAAESAAIREEMIRLAVTAKELRAAFGEPEDPTGWWPIDNWHYPGLSLELRLGVVEGQVR